MVHQTYTLYQVVPKRSVCPCQTCQIKLVGVGHCFAWQVTHPTRLRQSMSALMGDPDLYLVNNTGNPRVLSAVPVPVPVNYPYPRGGYGFACGSAFSYPGYTRTRTRGG